MSKRRNENGQMRREEYEAIQDDDGSADFGAGPVRASEETLATRRIVTAKRPKRPAGGSAPTVPAAPANPFAGVVNPPAAAPSSTPFAGFSGLAAPASTNPFAAFKGLAPSAPTPATSSQPKAPAVDSFSAFQGLVPAAAKPAAANPTATSGKTLSLTWIEGKVSNQPRDQAQATCMELLNKEFFAFVQQQIVENPMALWTHAIQEYIKHVATLEKDLDTLYGTKKASTTAAPFTFGVPKDTSEPKPVSSGVTFGATKPTSPTKKSAGGFTVGATESTSGFTFGAKTDKPSTSGFTFGATTPADKAATSPAKTSGGFTFGAAKESTIAKPTSSGFSFGSTSDAAAKPASTGFSFGDAPVSSSSGFSFGTKAVSAASSGEVAPPKPAPEASKPTGFSFGGSSAPSTTAGFSFGSAVPAAPSAAAGGFAFNLPNKSAAAPSAGGDDDDDDENVGREEATVIIKSDSESDETVLFEEELVRLRQYKATEKEWADLSAHPLKVLQNKATMATRILIRNSIGKIMLNAGLFAGMTITAKPKSVLIPLMHEGKLANYLFSIPPARIAEFKDALEKNIPK
ncbi:Aste57867_23099 [Aphanomyces stellatus]|uniref:Aste57867_23099 protein n=1 Tax=Aphanomyces stellatus TaxID=120398 RepID=A0A485LM07_9STRA|nr:hypothetical protein As57867_023028 [Aphanomyces stellatus]VFT99747.1 Aste57867_23099 [Aphanomyces stellatus]